MEINNLNSCGSCEGISTDTPIHIHNRPGLSAISYRIGNHAQFKQSLLSRLSISKLNALRKLKVRSDDDFTIALLDAWATVSDVLTFYQERIANESYLSTAVEQLSVLELARLIGYELRPGVAASTYVAFNLDENSLSAGQAIVSGIERGKEEPLTTTIHSGTKIQSVPGPEEEPQNFETVESIEALPQWNAMRPQLTQIQNAATDKILIINGTNNNIKAGDMLLILPTKKMQKVIKVALNLDTAKTWLYLEYDASLPAFDPPIEYIPDGHPDDFPADTKLQASVVQSIIQKTWTAETLSSLIETKGWSHIDLTESIEKHFEAISVKNQTVYVFRRRATFFGYNAPLQITYSNRGIPSQNEWNLDTIELADFIYLDNTYEEILEDSYIAIQGLVVDKDANLPNASIYKVGEVDHLARTAYGMSSKSTRLKINPITASPLPVSNPSNYQLKILRPVTVHVQSESLPLTTAPVDEVISGNIIRLSKLYLGLKKGRPIILSGERADLSGTFANELGMIKEVYIYNGRSVLVLEKSLVNTYIRKKVTINANIALATHGETVTEVLGNGDARSSFQKFVLKQPPLTFVSAASSSGTASTLKIRVNDILWTEVASFYNHGPNERIYVTKQNDQGETTVIFGNGITGARLPTGQANVSATYRKGIGSGGLLEAHQLTQLLSSPQGVKSVTNPLTSTGAEDKESLSEARSNATLTIYTLGRIVSLQDYEDFCRSFAGISKAMVNWAWSGQKRSVYITVAGTDGATIESDGEVYENLLTAIDQAGIPDVAVTVKSYLPAFFRVAARIKVHDDFIAENVLKSVEEKLRDEFSFDKRSFGQAVSFSEVISTMQKTEGVVAVDIDHFYRSDKAINLENDRLTAFGPKSGGTQLIPAELLILDPSPVQLNIMS